MAKNHIEHLVQTALVELQRADKIQGELPRIQIEPTKDKQHGDFACNIALILAKTAGLKPRALAELIVEALPPSVQVEKVDIAGPGFINFFLAPAALHQVIFDIFTEGQNYGRADIGKGKRVLVEFVSSNPTGPLHVGHGRHAAFGAVVCDLLALIGYDVHREYYVNDAGRQMDILAVSVWLRYLAINGETITFPSNGYQGDYVIDIAQALQNSREKVFLQPTAKLFDGLPLDAPDGGDKEIYIDAVIARAKELLGEGLYRDVFDFSLTMILRDIRGDLEEFGVHFQEWFSEYDFVQTDVVDRLIRDLEKKGLVYKKEGALWFRSSDLGDEKDRVLERSNGQRTYFANDFAYHVNKFERGFDEAIDIFGSDHHGYIPRVKAGLRACAVPENKLTYLLLQFVSLYRGGELVPMSTRSGSFITLRELREEVGNDAARFFYVMRKGEQHIDFDLDLAKSKSNENPVFYIQYAHARVSSVFKQLQEKSLIFSAAEGFKHLALLTEKLELQLIATLARYTDVIVNAATQHEPSILTNYLRELAADFHAYYNSHQFLVEDTHLRDARLTLISAVRQVLANGLKLLGVSAPETM